MDENYLILLCSVCNSLGTANEIVPEFYYRVILDAHSFSRAAELVKSFVNAIFLAVGTNFITLVERGSAPRKQIEECLVDFLPKGSLR